MKTIFQTERLIVRQLSESDTDEFCRLNASVNVRKYVSDGTVRTPEQSKQALQLTIREYDTAPASGMWAIEEKRTGKFSGICFLLPLEGSGKTELGYRLPEEHWGKGYATEAAGALLVYANVYLGLKRIIALVHPQNKTSIRVIEKIGLNYEKDIEFNNRARKLYSISF